MLKNKTKLLVGILGLVVILLKPDEVVSVATVHAQLGQFIQNNGGLGGLNNMISTLAIVNTFLYVVLLIALNMMQYLLQSDYFSNGIMMSALNSIWVLSRDIVNIGFALMLIGVAVYTIITADTKYVKEKLVHFVLAVILVNFSWFFPRVIIDAANVLTATVFSIPQALPGFTCTALNNNGVQQPCFVIVDTMVMGDSTAMSDWCRKIDPKHDNINTICKAYPGFFAWKKQTLTYARNHGMSPAHAMLNGLAVSFANVTTLPNVAQMTSGSPPTGTAGDFVTGMNLLITILMTLFFQIAVILPIVGLAIGFLVRIVVLWVCVAFMPFTFIGYAIKGTLTTSVFGFEFDLWKQFTTAALLPAIVGVPITIGFIMMSAVAKIPAPGNFPQTFGLPLIGGVSNWWALLWMVAAVGILWKGAFDALKRNDIVGKFTEPIHNFGNTIFRAGMQLPLLTPLPIPGMPAGTNLGTALNLPNAADNIIRAKARGMDSRPLFDTIRNMGNPAPPAVPAAAAAAASGITPNQARDIVTALEQIRTNTTKAQMAPNIANIRVELQKIPGMGNIQRMSDADVMQTIAQASQLPGNGALRAAMAANPNAAQDAQNNFNNRT